MNFKRILVLVMTFAMLLSTFAPTLGVFAENINNGAKEIESNEKHYVSIGDSMANGYGFDGYQQGNDGVNIINNQGKFYGAGAYPLQFEKHLKEQGYDVTHTKLASSALRAEDLLYLLDGRDTPADDWFDQVNYYTGIDNDDVLKAFYQDAVKDADIITLGIGNASFGAFFLSRVTSMLGVMGGSLTEEQKAQYTLENALKLLDNEEEKEIIREISNKVSETMNSFVSKEEAEKYHVDEVSGLLSYTAAGFIVNFSKSVDKIVELNPDAEIILVGLMNTTYGMTIDLGNGEKFYFGDLMDEVFALLNDYIVLYPTLKQAEGKLQGATFHYAEQPQPKFIVQAFDDLAYAGWTNIDCGEEDCGTEGHVCEEGKGRLSADIVRARTIKTYNNSLRLMISSAMGMNLLPVTLADVQAWRSWETIQNELRPSMPEIDYYPAEAAWNFMHGNSDLTASVAVYLAIEDAIVRSIAVDDIPLEGVLTIADMNKLLGVFDGLESNIYSPYTVRQSIGDHLSQEHILPLCKIYAIFNIGDGMCVHPTPAGHDDLAEVIIEAYNEKDGIPADVVLEKMHHVYTTASDMGVVGEMPQMSLVEDLYETLDAHNHITDKQTLDIILAAYTRVLDKELSDKDTIEIGQCAYDIVVRNPLINESERIEIIGEIYAILKGNNYFAENEALELIEVLYKELDEKNLISDEQSYAIADYIYEAILDGVLSDAEQEELVKFMYETLIADESLSDAHRVAVMKTVYSTLKANGYIESDVELYEELYRALKAKNLLSDSQIYAIADQVYLAVANDGELTADEEDALVKFVYETMIGDENIPESQKVAVVATVYKVLKAHGYVALDEADIAEEIYKALKAKNLLSDKQTYAIVEYVYEAIIDGEFSDEEQKSFVEFVYETMIGDENIPESQKVAVVATVYKILKAHGYVALDEADIAEEIYKALKAKNLLSDKQTYAIVEYVYEAIIDGEFSDEEQKSFVEFVYETMIGDENIPESQKVAVVATVYKILKAHGYLEDYADAKAIETAEEIYKALKAENLLSDKQTANIVDYVYNAVIDGDVTDEELLDIVLFVYKLVIKNEAPARQMRARANATNNDAASAQALRIVISIVAENYLDEENKKSLETLVTGEGALISDELLVKILDNVMADVESSETVDQATLVQKVSTTAIQTVLDDPNTDPAVKTAIVNEIKNVADNNQILDNETSDIYDEAVALAGKIYENLKAEGLMGEAEKDQLINILIYSVVLPVLNGEQLEVNDAIAIVVDIVDVIFGREDLTNKQRVDIFVVVYETLDEEGYITEENGKIILDFILEYYDEAYEYGYAYADEEGYIDIAVEAIKNALAYLETVDFSDKAPMTEEIRALLQKEVDLIEVTLAKLIVALEADTLKDVDGLVSYVLANTDELLEHLANIYDICAQAGIDVNQLVLLPALKEALYILETEVIPALVELTNEIIDATIAHITEKAELLYNAALGMSKEVYLQLVALIVKIQLHVDGKIEEITAIVLEQYFALVEKLETIYGVGVEAYEKALEIYTKLVDKLLGKVLEHLDVIENIFGVIFEVLVESGLTVHDAITIAIEVYKAVVEFIAEYGDDVLEGIEIAKVVFTTVYNFLVENGENIKTAFNVAINVYKSVVEFLVENADNIEKAIEIAKNAFEYVLEVAGMIYDNAEEIYAIATGIYAELVKVIAKVEGVVLTVMDVYNYVYELIVDIFGSVENAGRIAYKIATLIVEFVKNNPEIFENAYKLCVEIYNIIVETYGETGDACETAKAVHAYALGIAIAVKEDIAEIMYNASNADYEITLDSYYVALGNAEYAEDLANMLFLGDKYEQFALTGDYLEALAKADLVTVKFNNGEFMEFANLQMKGMLAEIIRGNKNLTSIYTSLSNWGILDQVEESLGFSLDSKPVDLEWSKYLDADAEMILKNSLARMKKDLIANGTPEYVDIAPVINAVLENMNIPLELDGDVNISVVDLMIFGIESALYGYVEAIGRVATTLNTIHTVAPEATVVITGVDNPMIELVSVLGVYSDYIGNVDELLGYTDVMVDVVNATLYGFALAQENTIFVNSDNAEDIYAALHAHCGHAYDNACDTTCNICGEIRTVGDHVYDNACDTTCNICGAVRTVGDHVYDNACDTTCNICGAVRTVGDHVYDNACDATCNICGATRTPADHVYDDCADDTCNVCGATRVAPGHVYDDKYDRDCNVCGAIRKVPLRPWAIVAIVVGSVAVVCGAGALVYFYIIKKKKQA